MNDLEKKEALLKSLAQVKNLRWLNEQVLVDATEHVVSTDLNTASKLLLGQTATANTLQSFESIVDYAAKLPSYSRIIEAAKKHGVVLPDNTKIPEYKPGQAAWFRMLINQCS